MVWFLKFMNHLKVHVSSLKSIEIDLYSALGTITNENRVYYSALCL